MSIVAANNAGMERNSVMKNANHISILWFPQSKTWDITLGLIKFSN